MKKLLLALALWPSLAFGQALGPPIGASSSLVIGTTLCSGCTAGDLLSSSGSPPTVADSGLAANNVVRGIDVASYATGGNGACATPWTGWDTAIPSVAGAQYWFKPGSYQAASLSFNLPVTLAGAGWDTLLGGNFGGGGWLSCGTNFGTVIYLTATSGNALGLGTQVGLANTYQYNIRDILFVGPGTGTSVGVALGQLPRAVTQSNWSNVGIANFSKGATFNNVENSSFANLRFMGDTTGLDLTTNTNQNTYINTQFQNCTLGLHDVNGGLNAFYGAIFQSCTTGGQLEGDSLSLYDVWGESNATTLFLVDSTVHGVKNLKISHVRASSAALITTAGANGVNFAHISDVEWGNGGITVPSTWSNTILENIEATSITDNGVGTNIISANIITQFTNPNIAGSISYPGTLTLGQQGSGIFLLRDGSGNPLTAIRFGTSAASPQLARNGAGFSITDASGGNAASLQIGSGTIALGTSEFGMDKVTDPNTAPGAGEFKLTVVAGTNAGTCKLVARAGTSATAVTVVDNVGGSC